MTGLAAAPEPGASVAGFSRDTLYMFRELLGQVSIPATHPEIVKFAQQIATANAELAAALEPPKG